MTNKQLFINNIAPVIKRIAGERGYKYAGAIIAQAAIESAWFYGSQLSKKYYNLFGMKCGSKWTGKSVNMATKEEYTAGTLTTIKDNFRAYNSLEEGINGYFDFIESMSRYSNLKTAASAYDYIEKLKADGWATSSTYVTNLKKTYNANNFSQYDGITTVATEISDAEKALAQDVIAGKYGNGDARKDNIYKAVQRAVNAQLSRS